MLTNYLKIALRNLLKYKLFSFINIFGLSIGMTAGILILSYIYYEINYERFNTKADQIYRIEMDVYQDGTLLNRSARSGSNLVEQFTDQIPEVISGTSVYPENCLFRYEDKKISGQTVYWTTNSFIEIFDLKLLQHSSEDPLAAPLSAVLTKSAAIRFFGDEDPIGKIITQNEGNQFTITGVVDDYPVNSHIRFDFLLSFNSVPALLGIDESVFRLPACNYILVQPGVSRNDLQNKITQIADNNFNPQTSGDRIVQLLLQPLTDIHLKSDLNGELSPNSNIGIIYTLSVIALIILIMAWINYVNLSTARALDRSREVGIRKVSGAEKIQIIKQFILESLGPNLIAFALSLELVLLFTPISNRLTGQDIRIPFFSYPQFWLFIFIFFLLCGVIAGLYPAFLLSSFNPVATTKGKFINSKSGRLINKSLVVIQFAAGIALIIATLVISRQITFLQNQDLGFNSDQVLVVNTPRTVIGTTLREDRDRRIRFYNQFKETLLSNPSIKSVTATNAIPGMKIGSPRGNLSRLGADQGIPFTAGIIVQDFFKLLDIDIIAGRDFTIETSTLETPGIIVNEKVAEMLGYPSASDAVNTIVTYGPNPDQQVPITGVAGNYHQEYLRKSVEPMIYLYGHNYEFGYFLIKLGDVNNTQTLKSIEKTWSEIYPDDPFDSFFLDVYYNSQYASDRRLSNIILIFSSIALIIAALGLFGLSSLSVLQRTKETGLRKVFGAPLPSLFYQLSSGFISLILLANAIAWPVIYLILNRWVDSFIVSINLNILYFLIPGLLVLLIAIMTISYITFKVARTNPANVLRYE